MAQQARERNWDVYAVGRQGEGLEGCTALLDASTAEGTLAVVPFAAQAKIPLVVGTTGHTQEQILALQVWSKEMAILKAANFSLGALVLQRLLQEAHTRLGADYHTAILDIHRKGKRDTPSGTALELAQTIQCETIESFRLAQSPGEHTVYFAGLGERLELTHRAYDRRAYAHGALKALEWIHRQPPGWYTMENLA